jgi:hypothetical protein
LLEAQVLKVFAIEQRGVRKDIPKFWLDSDGF